MITLIHPSILILLNNEKPFSSYGGETDSKTLVGRACECRRIR
ncbi:hypothetical protein V6Z12_D11G166800 [Gossypium hirsutum]